MCLQRATGSALHEAACCGHAEVVDEMLKQGAKHDAATLVSQGELCVADLLKALDLRQRNGGRTLLVYDQSLRPFTIC